MNKNIEDLLMKNGDDFKEEILRIVMNVSHLMEECHAYEVIDGLVQEGNVEMLNKLMSDNNEFYLALGYLMAKKGSGFWKTVPWVN